jgi:hypothetical protein
MNYSINNNAINNSVNNAINNVINNAINNTIYNTIIDTILDTSFYEDPIYKNVISEEEFNKLEKKHYSISSPFNNTCPITQVEFLNDEGIIELPCNHCFNPTAIKKWLMEEKGECPVCRYKFETIEKESEQAVEQGAEQAVEQAVEQAAVYNPNDFNDVYNNFMETDIIYVFINNYIDNYY